MCEGCGTVAAAAARFSSVCVCAEAATCNYQLTSKIFFHHSVPVFPYSPDFIVTKGKTRRRCSLSGVVKVRWGVEPGKELTPPTANSEMHRLHLSVCPAIHHLSARASIQMWVRQPVLLFGPRKIHWLVPGPCVGTCTKLYADLQCSSVFPFVFVIRSQGLTPVWCDFS